MLIAPISMGHGFNSYVKLPERVTPVTVGFMVS